MSDVLTLEQRIFDFKTALVRAEKEIESLKKDSEAQDAILRDLQERISKLETAQNRSR